MEGALKQMPMVAHEILKQARNLAIAEPMKHSLLLAELSQEAGETVPRSGEA